MSRRFTVFMFGWMVVLTAWTAVLTMGVSDRVPEAVASVESPMLDVSDPVLIRWETGADAYRQEVLPPRSMPLWQYVQQGTQGTEEHLSAFEAAFEQDLHNGDSRFHLTHEVIDGKTW